MYICLCHAISDKTIVKLAIEHDAYDVQSIRRLTPLGSQCGKCVRPTKELLQQIKAEQTLRKVS
ncbi:(2Fe-2S)-binding protein [Thaumasiovibrio sp. DFM-14]|uniref:(2Fe-2S)-binding protein n=1 Tax=Thaumasiovibrio sp. DFM-14 TaxID=3384792 RepID=UPI0039A13325